MDVELLARLPRGEAFVIGTVSLPIKLETLTDPTGFAITVDTRTFEAIMRGSDAHARVAELEAQVARLKAGGSA